MLVSVLRDFEVTECSSHTLILYCFFLFVALTGAKYLPGEPERCQSSTVCTHPHSLGKNLISPITESTCVGVSRPFRAFLRHWVKRDGKEGAVSCKKMVALTRLPRQDDL